MGFFSGLVHAIASPVEHLIGKTATSVLFPAIPISQWAAKGVDTLSNKILAGHATPPHVSPVPVMQRHAAVPTPTIYGSGYAPAPYYGGGGGGFDYSFQPAQSFTGGSPWDYSTQFSQPLTMPSVAYSAPTQDRSWEDLILAAAPFIL